MQAWREGVCPQLILVRGRRPQLQLTRGRSDREAEGITLDLLEEDLGAEAVDRAGSRLAVGVLLLTLEPGQLGADEGKPALVPVITTKLLGLATLLAARLILEPTGHHCPETVLKPFYGHERERVGLSDVGTRTEATPAKGCDNARKN